MNKKNRVNRHYRLVRLADSAGFSQPQQYFSLTQNQPSHQPTSQPTIFSSHAKSASHPASQPAEQGVKVSGTKGGSSTGSSGVPAPSRPEKPMELLLGPFLLFLRRKKQKEGEEEERKDEKGKINSFFNHFWIRH